MIDLVVEGNAFLDGRINKCCIGIDEGKIVESGTHDELLEKKGKYWELYNIQEK